MVTVTDVTQGFLVVKDILYTLSDKKTVLFLSGGRTPKEFYTSLSKEATLVVGAVGLIDERYGEKMHENSNESMIAQTGLLDYLKKQQTPFYPILQTNIPIEDTTAHYDETLRFLINRFSKSIGILGIGLDGHTAGIPSEKIALKNKDHSLVSYFTDFPGPQKERISMTFLGLSMLDLNLILVFGEDKKEALQMMFEKGLESEIPARFFKRTDIASKTLLITDQKV
jgi:6-phosphogluconolactonase/glucosamine-6-phosphate isomerase/deaminase